MSLAITNLMCSSFGLTFILGDENICNWENSRILVTGAQLAYKGLLVALISQPKDSLLFCSQRMGLGVAN